MKYSRGAYWEIFYPFIISIILGVVFYSISEKFDLDFNGLVDASLNLFGILIGFLITVLTIINTIENTYTRALKKGKSFHLLSLYLKHAIWGCFISIIFSIVCIFFLDSIMIELIIWVKTLFILSFLFALMSSYRFIRIFLKLTLKNS